MTENKTKLPKGLHVLFADDEESLQELIRFELPRMGHKGCSGSMLLECVADGVF